MKKITFTNSQGIELVGLLDEVSEDKKIVIFTHGFTSDYNGSSGTAVSQGLHDAGMNCLRITLFGHGESQGDFSEFTVSEGIDDVLCAIKYVKSLGYEKIGIGGASLGGITSLGAALNNKDVLKLGLIAPVSDFPELLDAKEDCDIEEWKKTDSYVYKEKEGVKYALKYYFYEDSKKWIMYDKVKTISCPVLIIHGTEDKSVPLAQSEKLIKQVKGELRVIDGADHRFTEKEHMDKGVSYLVDFFKEL